MLSDCDLFAGGVEPDITFKHDSLSRVEIGVGEFNAQTHEFTAAVSREMEGLNSLSLVIDAVPAATYYIAYRAINIMDEGSDWYLAHADYLFEENHHYTLKYVNDSIWIDEGTVLITVEENS